MQQIYPEDEKQNCSNTESELLDILFRESKSTIQKGGCFLWRVQSSGDFDVISCLLTWLRTITRFGYTWNRRVCFKTYKDFNRAQKLKELSHSNLHSLVISMGLGISLLTFWFHSTGDHYILNEYDFIYLITTERSIFHNYTTFIKIKKIHMN